MLPVKQRRGADHFFVLEFSTNQLQGAPGRLSRYSNFASLPVVITDPLVTPTSRARDAATGELFITEIRTGKIIRVQLQ